MTITLVLYSCNKFKFDKVLKVVLAKFIKYQKIICINIIKVKLLYHNLHLINLQITFSDQE